MKFPAPQGLEKNSGSFIAESGGEWTRTKLFNRNQHPVRTRSVNPFLPAYPRRFYKSPGNPQNLTKSRDFHFSFRYHGATLEGENSKINNGMTWMETGRAPMKRVPLLFFLRLFYLAAMKNENFSVAENLKPHVKTKN